jgi:hypothetical protein
MAIYHEKDGLYSALTGITIVNLALLISGTIIALAGTGKEVEVGIGLVAIGIVNLVIVSFAKGFARGLYLEATKLREKETQ